MPLGYNPRVAALACSLLLCFVEWLGAVVHWLSSFLCLRWFKPILKKPKWINRRKVKHDPSVSWIIMRFSTQVLLLPGAKRDVWISEWKKKIFPPLSVSEFNLRFCPSQTSRWCPCPLPQSLTHTSLKAMGIYHSSRHLHAWLWKCRNPQNMVPAQRAALHA